MKKGREETRNGCIVGGLTLERASSLTWIKVTVESTMGSYPERSFPHTIISRNPFKTLNKIGSISLTN